MALVDMKRTEEDMKAEADCLPCGPDGGQYPYGLNISMDKDELDKLGITKLPEIGAEFHMQCVGVVTRVSQSADLNSSYSDRSMSLQITMMEAVEEPGHPGEGNETPADEKREFRTLLG